MLLIRGLLTATILAVALAATATTQKKQGVHSVWEITVLAAECDHVKAGDQGVYVLGQAKNASAPLAPQCDRECTGMPGMEPNDTYNIVTKLTGLGTDLEDRIQACDLNCMCPFCPKPEDYSGQVITLIGLTIASGFVGTLGLLIAARHLCPRLGCLKMVFFD